MPKKKRTINKASIAILKTHVEYIREAIDKLDNQFSEHLKWGNGQLECVNKNFKNMDDRIQKLEDWIQTYEKTEERGIKGKSLKIAYAALIISTIINIITILLSLGGYV